jgi:hypothetical protein
MKLLSQADRMLRDGWQLLWDEDLYYAIKMSRRGRVLEEMYATTLDELLDKLNAQKTG